MKMGLKIKAVRIAEGLSQPKMAQVIDIPIGTLRNCEQDRAELRMETLIKIAAHKQFKKYAYWLMTNETLPESGQIAPDFSILLELGIVENEIAAKRIAK